MAKKKNPAGGQLSTKLVYLDLTTILANYRDPKFWGKQWTIFKSGDIEIYWMMTHIDVKRQTIQSEVHIRTFKFHSGKYNRHWYDDSWYGSYGDCRDIPISDPEYTQQVFELNILSAVLKIIKIVENHFIRGYAEYRKASALEDEEEEAMKDIAQEIADEYVVSGGKYSNTIKDAFIDKYVSDHTTNYTNKVLAKYDHKVLGHLYLLVCSWFGREDFFNDHKILVGDNKKSHIWSELFAKAKEIQTEEWRNAMAEAIKDAIS